MSESLREHALSIYRAGLVAAQPRRCLELHREEILSALPGGCPVWLAGAGKAAAHLAAALREMLSRREIAGRVIVKHGHGLPLEGIVVEEAGHPLPDVHSLDATRRLLDDLETLRRRQDDTRLVLLLTGGASSLLVSPAPGITLRNKIETTDLLLRSGATIQELNAVRKHLSEVKGGRLLARMGERPVLVLVVSDVVGDDLSSIGSGPAVADPTTFGDCLEILNRYRLVERVPEAVRRHLQKGLDGALDETPKPGDAWLERARHLILASNRDSLLAAAGKARELGFDVEVFRSDMQGSVHDTAVAFAEALASSAGKGSPRALLAGGELTIAVSGSGKGGRNQEFALVAARELDGVSDALVLSAGTDGTDGPTDAAGAIADGTTWDRAESAGIEPAARLTDNDSYTLFDRLGDLIRTGPTGTNVNDLVIGLTGEGGRRS